MNLTFLKKNKKVFISLAIIIILISTTIGIIAIINLLSDSMLHSPIKIESDADFISYEFPGNGTQDNPYIIENFKIGADGRYAVGINISNTNSFFKIKNCLIYTDYIGIELSHIASGTAWIINNICISKTGRGGGINLDGTTNCTIKANICKNLMMGIHLNQASHCLIKLNLIEDNNYQGINIRYSSYNVIINNTVKMTPQHAIVLVGNADWNKIYHNVLIDNAYLETYEVDGRLTGLINSQGFDEGNNNYWYDDVNNQGNYWSDYQGIGNYSIDGPAGTEDKYPFEVN